MRTRALLALVLLTGFDGDCGGCGVPVPVPVTPPPNGAALPGFAETFTARYDGRAAGYAYAFVQNGALRVAGAHGYARMPQDGGAQLTSTKRMHIASISKPITATALMTLVESHGVDIDKPFLDYLGGEFTTVAAGVEDVTLRQLLTHSGGMAQWGNCGPKLHDSMAALIATPMTGSPGAQAEYSNGNFCLLRRVVEAVSGRPYVDYVRDHVLLPLGITDMSCRPDAGDRTLYYQVDKLDRNGADWTDDFTETCGAYGWHGSALDLAHFGDGLRRGQIVSDATFQEMIHGTLGLWHSATSAGTAYHHNGGWVSGGRGYRGGMVMLPNGVTAVVLVNSWGDDEPIDSILTGYELSLSSAH